MPMPILDPARFVEAVLADPSHKLPLPDRAGRLFLAEGEVVDAHHPFYAGLLADGSLRLKLAEPVKAGEPVDEAAAPKAPIAAPAPARIDPPVAADLRAASKN